MRAWAAQLVKVIVSYQTAVGLAAWLVCAGVRTLHAMLAVLRGDILDLLVVIKLARAVERVGAPFWVIVLVRARIALVLARHARIVYAGINTPRTELGIIAGTPNSGLRRLIAVAGVRGTALSQRVRDQPAYIGGFLVRATRVLFARVVALDAEAPVRTTAVASAADAGVLFITACLGVRGGREAEVAGVGGHRPARVA